MSIEEATPPLIEYRRRPPSMISYKVQPEIEGEDSFNIVEVLKSRTSNLPGHATSRLSDLISEAASQDSHTPEDKGKTGKTHHLKEKTKECPTGIIRELEYYLCRRRIKDLMHLMMQHLVVNEPGSSDDPVDHLRLLMDHCLAFRNGMTKEAPLVFEDRHVASLYKGLDPAGNGHVSLRQYHVGMRTLGLKEYEMNPDVNSDGEVNRATFIALAKIALVADLMDMIMLPPPRIQSKASSLESL